MNELFFNRLPITTGKPQITRPQAPAKDAQAVQPKTSFQEMLQNSLDTQQAITFSKHAAQRVVQRGIEISEHSLARLNEGVRLAGEKGLNDTLILVDSTAFLVNVKDNKVITTVNHEDLKGNVFTNIDGTVII